MPNPQTEYVPLMPSETDEEYLRLRREAVERIIEAFVRPAHSDSRVKDKA